MCWCVSVSVCLCLDLWSFFLIYLVGILAILAKMVQDLAELSCLEKEEVKEEVKEVVKEELQPPSVPRGASVQAHKDFAFGDFAFGGFQPASEAFAVPGNRQSAYA